MSFSLENYSVPITEEIIPSWAKLSSTKLLYENVVKNFNKIYQAIQAGENLSIKDRKIVLRRIAIQSNFDPSSLSKRRQPQLFDFINKHNLLLQELWDASLSRKYRSGRKKKKEEVINDNRKMAIELKRVTSLEISHALTEMIKSELTEAHQKLVANIEELKFENDVLREQNSALNTQLRQLLKLLNKLDK
jgi:hypothetical protein